MAKVVTIQNGEFVVEFETMFDMVPETYAKNPQLVVGHHQSERIFVNYPSFEDVIVLQNPDGTFSTWYEGY